MSERRWKTNVDIAIEQRAREVRAENERRQAAREAGLPDPTRRWKTNVDIDIEQRAKGWKTPVDLAIEQRSRELHAESERQAADGEIQGQPLDTASLETAQQAARVASSALHFISGILGRGSR
jgi:hypothetical protein